MSYARESLVAIKEYYIQDETDQESISLVKNIFMDLYNNTTSKEMQAEILEYAWENKFCVDCGEPLKFYGEEDNVEFWDCPCSREV